jgi:uncharacterized membrane protein
MQNLPFIADYPVFFILWNTFLALVPCWIVWQLARTRFSHSVIFAIGFIIWFFFFPNTAYLFTEVRHLINHCDAPDLYDVCRKEAWMAPFFFLYASIGIPTFIYALRGMTNLLGEKLHFGFHKWFPVFMIPITAMGVMLGLVERFNSWDIVTKPWAVALASLRYLMDPSMILNVVVYSAVLYVIYYIAPHFLKKIYGWSHS